MFNKQITAKEIYVFTERCIDIQKNNIKLFEEEIKNVEKQAKKIKDSNDRKKVLMRKGQLIHAKNEANEKIEYLINTLSIIAAVFEKHGKAVTFKKSEKEKLLKKYNEIIEDVNKGKKNDKE